jgi:hypothetical protein
LQENFISLEDLTEETEKFVQEIIRWKSSINSGAKWLIIALISGTGGIISKLIFDHINKLVH